MPPDLTFAQLHLDPDNLEAAEAAYQTEVAREYDFTVSPQHESREPELAEQTA